MSVFFTCLRVAHVGVVDALAHFAIGFLVNSTRLHDNREKGVNWSKAMEKQEKLETNIGTIGTIEKCRNREILGFSRADESVESVDV